MTDWFKALGSIISRHEAPEDPHALPRAAAALMLELAVTEEGGDAAELETVHAAMQRAFGIPTEELDALIEQAHEASRQSVSLFEFTRILREGLLPEQRGELIEWLWRVALADARLGTHEEHVIRRAAELLGVPHQEFIRRKLLAAGAAHAP